MTELVKEVLRQSIFWYEHAPRSVIILLLRPQVSPRCVSDGRRCPQQGCICHESLTCGGLHTVAGCRAWWRVSACSSNSCCDSSVACSCRTAEHWTTGLAAKPLVNISYNTVWSGIGKCNECVPIQVSVVNYFFRDLHTISLSNTDIGIAFGWRLDQWTIDRDKPIGQMQCQFTTRLKRLKRV